MVTTTESKEERAASKAKAKAAAKAAAPKAGEKKLHKLTVAKVLDIASRMQPPERFDRGVAVPQIFQAYTPMPGVIPKRYVKMAMDDAASFTTWAEASIGDLIRQGLTFLGYPLLAEMSQRPEYRRISDVFATEATREWIEIKATGDSDKTEKIKALEKELDRLDLRGVFRSALMMDGYFGRAHIYIDTGATRRPAELKTPICDAKGDLTPIKIKKGSIRALKAVEPSWTYPVRYNSNDPLADDWYRSEAWFVMGKEVHSSRLLTLISRPVPDILKPAYAFGGLSLTQMARPYVDKWLRTQQSVSDLLYSFSLMILKTNMQTQLQGGAEEGLLARAMLFNLFRNNRSMMLVDNEDEEVENVAAPLSTLDTLQAQSQEHVGSAMAIPNIKYTGIQPAGLNASSDGELRVWYDGIKAYQEGHRDNLTWIIQAVQISIWGAIDEDITFVFKPLVVLSEKERADLEKTKAETDDILVNGVGALSPDDSRARIAGDPLSAYEGIDPKGAPGIPDQGDDDEENEGDDTGGTESDASGSGEGSGSKPESRTDKAGALKPKKPAKVDVSRTG